MHDSDVDFIKTLFLVLVGIAVVSLVSICGLKYLSEKPRCEEFGALSKNDIYWSLHSGCLVKLDGRWMDLEAAKSNISEIKIKDGK